MSDIDHERTDKIICPWCGVSNGESWEYDGEEETELHCVLCDKKFNYETDTRIRYTTIREVCETGECEYKLAVRDYGGNPYIYDNKNWTIYKCSVCHDEEFVTTPIAEDGKPYTSPIKTNEVKS